MSYGRRLVLLKNWQKECAISFIRGQGNAKWPLIPQILRKNKITSAINMSGDCPNADERVGTEMLLLDSFVRYCDHVGIKLPGDSLVFRNTFLNMQASSAFNKCLINPLLWPNPELFELMAMAQHHRVPTRLLDWTNNPYVAVYFAASSAVATSTPWGKKKLAIWALNTEWKFLATKISKLLIYRDR